MRISHLAVLIFISVSASNVHAGLLEETCDLTYTKLGSGPYDSMTKSIEDFTTDGKTYKGCVLRLSGNFNKVTKTQKPGGLFGSYLYHCPDGKLPDVMPRDFLNEQGWCGDNMGDGPDGTSYTVHKKNIFCTVEGSWDGGDDSDPKYVLSPRFSVLVMCGSR